MLKKLISQLVDYVGGFIYRVQRIYVNYRLDDNSRIDKSANIKGSTIVGNIKIDKFVTIYGGVYISGDVSIGNYSTLNGPNLDIYTKINKVIIGKFCSIARNVSIQEFNHNTASVTTYLIRKNFFKENSTSEFTSKGDIIIGNDVWIGAHSVILSGVKIGDGAIVAANSVVNQDIPPYAIVAGSPAKIINFRFNENIINKLLIIRWWDWDDYKIKENKNLFLGELTESKINEILN